MSENNNVSSQGKSVMCSSELLSSTIDLLRFPLAIMVIFIHTSHPTIAGFMSADYELLSGHGIYSIVATVCSGVFSSIAVPAFFLISGFLFFNNFRTWSWDGYKRKLRSRLKTLFIPYILWNILCFLLIVLSRLGGVILKHKPLDEVINMIQEMSWHILYDCNVWGTERINWLGDNLRSTGPIDLPLWFLRDLIVVTLLTPVLYYAIRKLKISFIIFLFLAYVSRIWILVPGFSITSFFYFSMGAYFALNGLDMVSFASKYKQLFLPASIILLVLNTICTGVDVVIAGNIRPFYGYTGVFSAFIVSSWCIRRFGMKPHKLLVSGCFFVYALHTLWIPIFGSPVEFSSSVLHKLIPGTSGLENGICYLLTPFVTAFLCIAILVVMRRLFPRITRFFSGSR